MLFIRWGAQQQVQLALQLSKALVLWAGLLRLEQQVQLPQSPCLPGGNAVCRQLCQSVTQVLRQVGRQRGSCRIGCSLQRCFDAACCSFGGRLVQLERVSHQAPHCCLWPRNPLPVAAGANEGQGGVLGAQHGVEQLVCSCETLLKAGGERRGGRRKDGRVGVKCHLESRGKATGPCERLWEGFQCRTDQKVQQPAGKKAGPSEQAAGEDCRSMLPAAAAVPARSPTPEAWIARALPRPAPPLATPAGSRAMRAGWAKAPG